MSVFLKVIALNSSTNVCVAMLILAEQTVIVRLLFKKLVRFAENIFQPLITCPYITHLFKSFKGVVKTFVFIISVLS